jgi:unsaturated pyranuronate lyase
VRPILPDGPLIDATKLPVKERLPGWHGRIFHSENMTFGYYEIAADAVPLHEHHHPQEEVWHVLEGELAMTVEGVEHVVRPECAIIIAADTPHSAQALSACRAIVVDSPIRAGF